MSTLRVALFTDSDVFAGTERYMLDLGCALSDLGVAAMIACPTPSLLAERASAEGLTVIPVPKAGLINRPAVRTLVELFQSGQLDIVHANNGRTSLASALAVRQARKGRFVATQHFLDPEHVSHTGVKAIVFHAAHRWVSKYMAHCIAISEAARAGVLRRGEAPEQKVTTVLNGIRPLDPEKLSSPAQIRVGLAIGADTPLVVCAARLEREKDVRSLIAAMTDVRAAFPDVRCVVAGQGAQQETLTAQINAAGLQDTVQLLGFRTDAQALIQAGDVFVLPSLAEPFGLVILEAMALGRPVIATDAGGPREIVEEGVTGLLVPPSDPPALAAAIRKLLADRQGTETMGRRGQERFQARFTAARMAQDMLALYRRIL
ncbi:MAG: glycosyltransferase family 1 protein [Chthonomonadaceae bacterium]|nr:glycosyltransferase family 1 protein [Chthonomonadaceae bacterium]